MCIGCCRSLCESGSGQTLQQFSGIGIRELHILDRIGLGAVAMGAWHTATCPNFRCFSEYGVGFAFSGVTLGLYVTFSAGAPISLGSPVIRFGGILLTSIAGLMLFREPITLRYVIGMLLACSGMYLILTR